MSKDLTEQWKKGELPCGWYYIKIADIVFIDFFEGKVWKNKKDKYIDEVLAPVPSYEEWFKIKNLASLTSLLQEKNIECLHRENKLKELLKECRYKIIADLDDARLRESSVDIEDFEYLLDRINKALGEEK